MIHSERVFSYKELEKEDELVEAMTNHTWPLCYSFFFKNLLYLSDGDREDSPEYSVVTIDSTEGHHGIIGREVGRIRPRELSEQQLHDYIQKMNSGHYDGRNPVRVRVEPKWHHSCEACRLEEM
jgi:hypothetical protein